VYARSALPLLSRTTNSLLNQTVKKSGHTNKTKQKINKPNNQPDQPKPEGQTVKFWPQKRWKKIMLTILLIVLAVFVGLFAYMEYSVYREVSLTETLNPSGSKIALVIYHPGLSSFSKDVASAYADGLVKSGWQVELTTASIQAPSSLSKYSLLALCWPIYDLNPAPTITNYIHQVGDLQGMNTTIITIGGGIDPLNASAAMNKTVQDQNGAVIQSLTLFRNNRNMTALTEQASSITP
jgi:hypothetical protein